MLPREAVQSTRPAYVLNNIEAFSSYDPSVDNSRSYDNMPPSQSQDSSAEFSHNTRPQDGGIYNKIPRSASYQGVPSSPLNPAILSGPPMISPFSRPGSRGSAQFMRIASEESRALSSGSPSSANPLHTRGAMILYRKAEAQDELSPPQFPHAKRSSTLSVDSVPLSPDSKYPVGMMISEHGLVAYAWDPLVDEPIDEEDKLHDPDGKTTYDTEHLMSLRGLINIAALVLLLSALLCLFVMYPVYRHYHDNGRNALIVGNTRINSTGQASSVDFDPRSQIPILPSLVVIDPSTPREALTRRSKDGVLYRLVFSDEFNTEGRTFYKDDDPFWEATDNQLHDYKLATTQDGYLVLKSRIIPIRGPQTGAQIRGFLKQRTSTRLDGGFVEVAVASPTSSVDQHLMWTGSWTSGDAEVPIQGASLSETVLLQLSLDSGPVDTLAIDFVRYYQRAGSELSPQSYGDTPLQTLKLPKN
ncbi:hypothetical protein C0995_012521 [Termitomyces sp. Mi166|nr:hypothetical protein C0995_012521 [Termitomyces sp. Mi166\